MIIIIKNYAMGTQESGKLGLEKELVKFCYQQRIRL